MSHQDFKTLFFQKNKKPEKQKVQKGPNIDFQKIKIDKETETFKLDKVSASLSKNIQAGRTKLGLSRDEFSKKLNVKTSVITDYENGKAIPDCQLLQKMSKILGITLKKKM